METSQTQQTAGLQVFKYSSNPQSTQKQKARTGDLEALPPGKPVSQCGDQACLVESDNPMALDACLIPAWRERVENGTRLQVACSSHSSPSTCTHGPDCWIHLSPRRLTAFQPLPDHLQPSDRHGANVSRAIPQPHALELEQSQSHRKQCPKDETSICISHDVEIPPPPSRLQPFPIQQPTSSTQKVLLCFRQGSFAMISGHEGALGSSSPMTG